MLLLSSYFGLLSISYCFSTMINLIDILNRIIGDGCVKDQDQPEATALQTLPPTPTPTPPARRHSPPSCQHSLLFIGQNHPSDEVQMQLLRLWIHPLQQVSGAPVRHYSRPSQVRLCQGRVHPHHKCPCVF